MLAELQQQSPCRLVFKSMQTHAGSVRARNEGVKLASGKIIAFTDSDCRVTPTWLELGLTAFDGDSNIAFATGPILNKPDQRVTFFSVGGNPLPEENPIYPLANAFYRKDYFWEIGGFDESVWLTAVKTTPVEYSDIDLAYRMFAQGYRNMYLEDLVVYHEVLQVSPWQWFMWNLRFVQLPEFLRRYPALRKPILWKGPFVAIDHVLFYLALIAIVLAIVVNPWWLLAALPYAWRIAVIPGREFSPRAWLFAPIRMALLAARQMLVTLFLLWGSFQARNLIL
jgi:GT2 family glycosyltransferase